MLGNKLINIGVYNPFGWAVMWANLAYNSIVVNAFCLNIGVGETFNKDDIVGILKYDNATACDHAANSLLSTFRDARDVNCTAEELDAIYSGLKSTPFDATLTQFNHLLDQQVARIGQARNRSKLKALWESVTGKESVKAWCDSFSTPIFWVIPKELRKPIHTVIDLQSGITTPRDTEVIAAIDALQNEKARVLTDAQKVYAALYETVGSEYVTYFKVHRPELLAKLKLSHGNDMSTWEAPELSRLQSMMKSAIQQQARQEKLQNTKNEIAEMPVSRLRENIASFLDSHPEYCDEFLK